MKKQSSFNSAFITPRNLLGVLLCLSGISLAMLTFAAGPNKRTAPSKTALAPKTPTAPSPGGGTLTTANQVITYTDSGPFVTNPSHLAAGKPNCTAPNSCSDFLLTVNAPSLASTYQVVIQIKWPTQANDFDTFLEDAAGNVVATNLSTADPETIITPIPGTSTLYHLIVVLAVGAPGDTITGTASLQLIPNAVKQGLGIPPRYFNYPAGPGQSNDAGEPSIGVDWNPNVASLKFQDASHNLNHGGVAFFKSGSHNWRVNFDDCPSPAINQCLTGHTPPGCGWEDVSATADQQGVLTDPIGFTDHYFSGQLGTVYPPPHTPGRVFTLDLIGGQGNSAGAFSDNDGGSYTAGGNGGAPQGGDHECLGGGPYSSQGVGGVVPPHPTYANAIYYCSQDIVAEAECSRSDNGGQTFGPGVIIFPPNTCTGGIHGHVKVAPDGTVYVPNSSCGTANGGTNGPAVSKDNGLTWNQMNVANSLGSQDPSIGIGQNNVGKPAGQASNTIYLGWVSADGHAHVAHSPDQGNTWQDETDVGSILGVQNAVFPVVVAGDDNRAAFGFIGTTTGGGCSTNPSCQAIWHLYIATTYSGGVPPDASHSGWILVDATPTDPVQTGNICLGGLSCSGGRNLLDFNDFSVDADGRGVLGYADGCIGCTNTFNGQSNASHGTVARQSGGRRLFSAFDPVEPMPPAAPQQLSAINGAGGVLVQWLEPDNGGSLITGYNVYRGTTSGSETFLAHVSGETTTKYLDPTPITTANVFYYVQAINGIGEGGHCGELSLGVIQNVESACAPPFLTKGGPGSAGTVSSDPTMGELTIERIAIGEPFTDCTDKSITFRMKVKTLDPGNSGMVTLPQNSEWQILFGVMGTDSLQHTVFVDLNTFSPNSPATPAITLGRRDPCSAGCGTLDSGVCTQGGSTMASCPKLSVTTNKDGTIDIKLKTDAVISFPAPGAPGVGTAFTWDATQPGTLVGTTSARIIGNTFLFAGVGAGFLETVQTDGGTDTYTTQGNFACAAIPPIAVLTATPLAGTAPLAVNFDASASSHPLSCANIASYTMTFGDGSPAVTQASPLFAHTYNNPGDYTARLTVTDIIGQVSTNSAQVIISVGVVGPPQLTGVVSQMVHGGVGTFNVQLFPLLNGKRGVECRSSASLGTGKYTVVFAFANPLTSVAGATVTGHDPATGTGSVLSSAIGMDPHQYIVNLGGVSTGQYITVTLTNAHDLTGAAGDVAGPQMGVLIGDVNFNGVASNADVSLVKAQVAAGASVGPSNFRDDVNANGVLTNADVSLTKAQVAAGAQLPSPP